MTIADILDKPTTADLFAAVALHAIMQRECRSEWGWSLSPFEMSEMAWNVAHAMMQQRMIPR